MSDVLAGSSEVAAPSTAATSITSAPRPSADEMFNLVFKAKVEGRMVEDDVWYIISGPWLNRFMQNEGGHSLSKEDDEGELGPIDNSDLVEVPQKANLDQSNTDDEVFVSEELILIKPGNCGDDFEIVPEHVWDSLVSWYGLAPGSPIIKRRVVNTSELGDEPNLQFEFYPPKFTVFKLRDPSAPITKVSLQNENSQSPKEFITTKAEKFQKFFQKVKRLADVEPSRKIRLWKVLGNFTEEEAEAIPPGVKKPNREKSPGITAGVGAGGIIVVEEQSLEGGWISEKNVKSAIRFGQPVTVTSYGKPAAITPISKKKTTSRSSSPSTSTVKNSPSKVTVIRGRREGRPQGKCGLSNLGNTCYMNSALQSLRSVKELSRYFISDEYEKELNPGNPLAHHGEVAKAYASLLKNIFSPTCPASFAPREFKTTIGRFGPSFQGYGQQDSQEFLAFLLDGLHEDLNRIQKKPYIEKPESTDEMVGDMEAIAKLASEHWGIYKKRNDSAVADLFGGLYQSTLVCPECYKVSITFDPFMDLTLPLPVENVWSKEIFFIPKDGSKGKLLKIPVEMDKNGSIKSLKEYVGKKMGIDPRMIMASEVYKYRFFKHYDDSATVSDQIQHNDDAYLYELDDIPTNWPSKNKKPKKSLYYGSASRFAFPFFILVNREEANSLDAIMSKVVEKYQLLTSQNLYEHVQGGCDDVEDYEEANEGVEMNKQKEKVAGDDGQEGGGKDGFVNVSMKDAGSVQDSENADEAEGRPPKNTNRRGLPTGLQELFNVKVSKRKPGDASLLTGWQSLEASLDIRERLYPDNPPTPPPRKPSVFQAAGGNSGRRSPESDRKNKGIHLEDCLDEFAKNEVLSEEDPWYCPRCKVHRRATKKFELWKCPDILVIHLKRFSSSRNFRDKIDVLIDCPVEGLDLSNRVGLKEEDHGLIYDLIAVDNHYGGLGGGHYTAYAKNWIDDKWYYCDDSNVREVLNADKVITPAAYLLFYRRRASRPLGGPHYERLISALEGASEDSANETASSRDASPNRAGEGGLSDDRTYRSSGGGVGGFSTIYSDQVGNGNLWGGGSGSTTKPDDSEESGIEMTSLLTVDPQPVELSYTELRNELIKDMDESDPEAETSGGGVFLQQIEQDDGEPADIVVDGEDTITPAPDQAS
ncbi:hypothetical protein DFP73DRAFT_575586 [Morchella snyderi]|nr:hypothetical protein DFP73DRAFT_575586 [Morchella snyderi]